MEKIFVATLSKVTKDHVVKANSVNKVSCILDEGDYISIEGEEPMKLCYINEDSKNIDENKAYMISVREYENDNLYDKKYLEMLKKAIKMREKINKRKEFSRKSLVK